MSCFTNSIVSLMSPLRPSFDKRPLLPLLSAFFRLYAFSCFLWIYRCCRLLYRQCFRYSAPGFCYPQKCYRFYRPAIFFVFPCFSFAFMFFVFGRNREYRYACVSDFILVSSFRCTLTVTDSMRASTMMSNISMKISQPISPPFRFGVRTVLR